MVSFGKILHEAGVAIARSSAQLMVEMANRQVFVAEIDKLMEQDDRVAPARNADEIMLIRRKTEQKLVVFHQIDWPLHRANVQRSTLNVQWQSALLGSTVQKPIAVKSHRLKLIPPKAGSCMFQRRG